MDYKILSFVNEHHSVMDISSKSAARQILEKELAEAQDMVSKFDPSDTSDQEYYYMFADDIEAINKALALIN